MEPTPGLRCSSVMLFNQPFGQPMCSHRCPARNALPQQETRSLSLAGSCQELLGVALVGEKALLLPPLPFSLHFPFCSPFPSLPPLPSPRLAWPVLPSLPKLKRQQAGAAYLSADLSTSPQLPPTTSSHYHATPPHLQHSSFTLLKHPQFLSHVSVVVSSPFYSISPCLLAF
jgi:hypothetical protein